MKKTLLNLLILIFAVGLWGCAGVSGASSVSVPVASAGSEPFVIPEAGFYDSADTSVITAINTAGNTITFYNYELRKSYTLNYDSLTRFADKYGTAMSVVQLSVGTVVDINFYKGDRQLVSLSENPNTFTVSDLTGFTIDTGAKVFAYKSDSYKITAGTVLIAPDKKMSIRDLNSIDNVSITGFDSEIYCITLNKGHGYLKLKGGEAFVDGYLEVGRGNMELITKNMLLTLAEGEYPVTVTKSGTVAEKHVTIEAGKESFLDLSDVKLEEAVMGKVYFDVSPSEAKLYVDGKIVDHSRLQSLSMGLHQLSATADGYDSVTKYFNVGKETSSVEVVLESKGGDSDTEEEEQSQTEGCFIFVTAPVDVEVYFDGNYIGRCPVSVAKKAGSHTITIRKTGYETRTYTVLIENTA
ncbi:MAG: PEGA domain-containing protein, partial [Lachnospiraceae bacterium]|nr:PEGA domain-containing protein [Lachnospiraceae bacterium]